MVKRDCIFYEDYQDMGAHVDFCNEKGSSWEDIQGCHCDDCQHYCSTDWLRQITREIIKERGIEKK